LGRFLAAALMILGYGVIAVPTGIVTTEMVRATDRRDASERQASAARACGACGLAGHILDAKYCRRCGAALEPPQG
jgi:voltage-gated potassium channel